MSVESVATRAQSNVNTGQGEATAPAFGANLPPWPQVDFAEFGEVEVKPVSRIQKLTGAFLSRNWLTVPHVTHHDDADITSLESYRKARNDANPAVKLTPLVFLIKAVVRAMQEFPQFNASLDGDGKNIVLKKYFHIGVAVDTRFGLLVPVLRDCDKKSVEELSVELAAISQKAREKGLSMAEMSGGCFSARKGTIDGRDVGRLLLDQFAGRLWRYRLYAYRQCAGGGDSRRDQDPAGGRAGR